jgi:hypothetical protein
VADLFHLWGEDLVFDGKGALLTVGGTTPQADPLADLANQRIIRRLLTNPGEYLWYPTYGAGLARFIGQPLNVKALTALVRGQLFLQPEVAQTPAPAISFQIDKTGTVSCSILYTSTLTGQATPLQFPITP